MLNEVLNLKVSFMWVARPGSGRLLPSAATRIKMKLLIFLRSRWTLSGLSVYETALK